MNVRYGRGLIAQHTNLIFHQRFVDILHQTVDLLDACRGPHQCLVKDLYQAVNPLHVLIVGRESRDLSSFNR